MGGRRLVLAFVLVAVIAVGGVFIYRTVTGRADVAPEDLSRVLIVAAAPDDAGSVVGQIIVIADVTDASSLMVESVSPTLEVTIPGTTYSMLGDAYPFGGGAGTVQALAGATGEEPLPYVGLSPDEVEAAVEAAGGVQANLPAAMSVFDGSTLYTFEQGEQTLTAAELMAVLKGAPYLSAAEREDLDSELAEALVRALAASPEVLETAGDTDLSPEALAVLQDAFEAAAR